MALIRGSKGLYPCPRCFVPHDQLSDLSQTYDKRTAAGTITILNQVEGLNRKQDKENLLKSYGLRGHLVRFDIREHTTV